MIEAVETSLPESKQVDIIQWLSRVEADEFLGSMKAEVAVLIAKASSHALDRPHLVLATPQSLGPNAEELLRKAARIQICIDVFEEKRHGEDKMITVTLKTI